MQLRVIKRLSSLELAPEEVLKVEFWSRDADQPDLRLSTYQVDQEEAARVFAEHTVSFLSPPRRVGAWPVDAAAGVRPFTPERGATRFRFANERHHELRFQDEADLLDFARSLCGPPPTAPLAREGKELLAYVRGRLAVADPEWVAGLQAAPHGRRWRDAVGQST